MTLPCLALPTPSTLVYETLSFTTGDVHKRQRKVMLPAFGVPETRAHSSVFTKHAEMVRPV